MAWVPNRRVVFDPSTPEAGLQIVASVPGKGIVRSRWSVADEAFPKALGLVSNGVWDGSEEVRFVAAGLLVSDEPVAPVRFRVGARPPDGWVAVAAPATSPAVAATLEDGAAWYRARDGASVLPFWPGDVVAEAPRFGPPETLSGDGFARLPPLVPALFAAELGRYYARLTMAGVLSFDAAMRRVVAYDEPLATFWHSVMTPLVAACVGTRLSPTFSYVAGYGHDGVLGPHTDRDACTWTLSWMLEEGLGSGPEPRAPWPLWVRAADGREVPIPLVVGESALMRGHELVHWRDPLESLGPDRHATLLIFCWTEDA